MANRLDMRDGVLTVAGGTERYILIPLRAYEAIIDAMRGLVGDAAAGPLYFLGKKIGRGLVEEVERLLQGRRDLDTVIKVYANYLSELGFGQVEILRMEGDEAVIKLIPPPSLEGMKLAGGIKALGKGKQRGVCHLERGMLAAVLDVVTGRSHIALELEHGETPAPYCVITVRSFQAAASRSRVAATA
jgi:predicted hydrocarbon binding protein